ncbi:MAG: hypothetical protein ACD_30C00018G0010 [uncultured bacterium]|uniref:Uncharacterized protein n=1 Tax=Candidatus Daviesbacteria bacterium GW2011_GWB1_36_5 TaxID=1618426 RepID=A0A0G0EMX3_9BACT|nr:MAG: hypothetical protein ACD_30C00018G0010 [uncultured bacterium]KKQ08388.1 MAG: hypothetical protein US19_C0025G0002 [Candidatus Daviesbacteria bacterium GW2011_GWB1_36_5]
MIKSLEQDLVLLVMIITILILTTLLFFFFRFTSNLPSSIETQTNYELQLQNGTLV